MPQVRAPMTTGGGGLLNLSPHERCDGRFINTLNDIDERVSSKFRLCTD